MIKPLKPWISFEDQLKILKDRGIAVDNDSAAISYLKRVGYYRLSGYWYPFREHDKEASLLQSKPVRKDIFIKGSRFEDVIRLYIFDKKLRLLALDALERIEMSVRVDIAHLLGEKDSAAHENPDCFHGNFAKKQIQIGQNAGKTEYQVWLEKYNSLLHRARRESFVEHHQKEYGKLPIWAAIELWDFGMLSKLFSGMQYADMQIIAAKYGAKDGREFAQWLRSLNLIRNVSAHHSRLWNINIVERSIVPQNWSSFLNNERPFFYFCIMKQMLNVICPNTTWGKRFTELLMNDFPDVNSRAISLADFGLIDKWEEWLLWC
ncbi:MAG: Abi family protein [Spirochaetes bacterium]|nr:Abi family protein [Spirochaetota bacterium]